MHLFSIWLVKKNKIQNPMKYIPLIIVLVILASGCNRNHHSVLTEAESFVVKGGWVVDPQFVEQMGSPYLLAHGLGQTVDDATTDINVPSPGRYLVWVRTRNWAPGRWDPPGRFKVLVNGKELKTVPGNLSNWHWQFAGAVKLKETKVTLTLSDLTGFDGRCDAVLLTTSRSRPPDSMEDLARWRKEILKESDKPSKNLDFDVVITGGGIAGCAASIAAAEQGLKVALIQDRPVLGGNASSEIRVHTEGITWNSDRILSMLNTVWWPNGSPLSEEDDKKRHSFIEGYENISVFLNWRAYAANSVSDSITSIDARHTSTGERMRFSAPLFIDCTGDGWIGYWAGAEYMYGREDSSKFGESWPRYGELWSPAKADNRVMGSSVLWLTRDTGTPVTFPEVPWALEVAGNYAATSGTWKWEYSAEELNQIDDGEKIRDHMLMAIYGSFYNAKKQSENANLRLEWVSYLIGKRESRRLVGDYIYTFKDERNMVEFPDAVVMEKRDIDVHYQQILADSSKPDFLSEALYYKVDHYYLPFRSLYSKNIRNLLMAGRCFSCSHAGLGGPRVMNTTGQMGVAVGYAASLCKKYKTNPRGVYNHHIAELQDLIRDRG
jgi:hypothetical protein